MEKQKRDIMLIANYWHFESEKVSSRYRSFANIICERYDLEVVTSTFCHLRKAQRDIFTLGIEELPYKMTLQYERGYKKNVCMQRIFSYKQFGRNVYSYLTKRKKPDLIIVSVPSLVVADCVTKYANKQNIPVILDIQDLWPEAFKMALDIPLVSDVLFYPMKKQAQRIYARANTIMAVSNTYAALGKKYNTSANNFSIYIGTDGELVNEQTKSVTVEKNPEEFWVGYVGALGHSYDIKSVIDALKILKDLGYTKIVFKVMGEGVLREEFEKYATMIGAECEFTGLLEYGVMMKTLSLCDIAVNPIVGKSVSTIINKVSDYAAAGVPVVNTQNSMEYRQLLQNYRAGISVENGNAKELANAIIILHDNEQIRTEMCENSRKMFEECFDRRTTYFRLLEEIEQYLN